MALIGLSNCNILAATCSALSECIDLLRGIFQASNARLEPDHRAYVNGTLIRTGRHTVSCNLEHANSSLQNIATSGNQSPYGPDRPAPTTLFQPEQSIIKNRQNMMSTTQSDYQPMQPAAPRVAVLVPCYNEEAAIRQVVVDFREALPEATIYVYDNNSRDHTVEVARAAGAVVFTERRQGKGNVVRRMFADIEADVYLLVDGDATYHAASAPEMVRRLLDENIDMVVGCRVHNTTEAYRPGHQFGNAILTGFVGNLFGRTFSDILSGYRVFSRRFVKSFPALSAGFETETELTVHALELRMPVIEIETPYGARPEGSSSKLSTYKDGFRILRLIIALYRHERPLQYFTVVGAALALLSVVLGTPLIIDWLKTGLVPRIPTAVLATATMIMAFLSFAVGLILETVTRGRQEFKRLTYLQFANFRSKR